MNTKQKGVISFFVVSFGILTLCQIGSYLIETHLPEGSIKVLIHPYLWLNHIRNLGGIFGVAQGSGWIFALVSILFIGLLVYYILSSKQLPFYEYICCGLVIGGGMSNVLDRLIYGSVIDYIDIRGIPHWKYIFNSADVAIHLGIWPMLILSFFISNDDSSEEVIDEKEQA